MTTRRGTTNKNARGGSDDRARRRQYLVDTYRADVDMHLRPLAGVNKIGCPIGEGIPACRCYRCGALLTVDTVTADRIIPGCQGGTYKRSNIRPACSTCNSITGGRTRKIALPPQPPIGGFCDSCGHFAARHHSGGCSGVTGECKCKGMLWQSRRWPRPWLPAPEGLKAA